MLDLITDEEKDAYVAVHGEEAVDRMKAIEGLEVESVAIALEWMTRKPNEPREERQN